MDAGGGGQPETAREAPRNSAIDVLRGWAVLSVVLLHMNIRVALDSGGLGRHLPKPLYRCSAGAAITG